MLDAFREATENQFLAALSTLHACVRKCSKDDWEAPVVELKFCQVVFHALFFTDYYLGLTPEAQQEQAFHKENRSSFRDYEELADRKQRLLYGRAFIEAYLAFCCNKVTDVVGGETGESLRAMCRFPSRKFTRAELHLYNLRHIQHHAAALSLWLRLDANAKVPWFDSGWEV